MDGVEPCALACPGLAAGGDVYLPLVDMWQFRMAVTLSEEFALPLAHCLMLTPGAAAKARRWWKFCCWCPGLCYGKPPAPVP
jgi:hypothetical protein